MSRTLRSRIWSQNPLPPGTVAVGIGIVVSGLSAYGFFVVSARALGPQAYAPLSVMWAALFFVGPGLFLPVEQEVSRAVAARLARGDGGLPVVLRAGVLGFGLLTLLVTVTLVASGSLIDGLFSGETTVFVGWLVGVSGYCVSHLARGTLSGQGRFGAYSRHLGGEALSRFLVCAVLAAIGIAEVGPYALAVGAAPFIGLAVALPGQRGLLTPGPEARWTEISTSLSALLAGSILSMAVANFGPLFIELLASRAEEAEAGRFLAALVVARIPLFLFQAVQAALLPKLSTLASQGRVDDFRRGFGRLVWFLAATAAAGILASFLIGPQVVRTFFGDQFALPTRTMGMLAVASGAFMIGSAVAQANIALGKHALQAGAWGVGVLCFLVVVAVASDDLYLRVEIASAASGIGALVAQAVVLATALRSGAAIERANLLDAISEVTVEP